MSCYSEVCIIYFDIECILRKALSKMGFTSSFTFKVFMKLSYSNSHKKLLVYFGVRIKGFRVMTSMTLLFVIRRIQNKII